MFSAKTGKLSVLSLFEFWPSEGTDWLLCRVSEASKGLLESSEDELSELLPQLAASRAVRVSRQKTRKLRGGG